MSKFRGSPQISDDSDDNSQEEDKQQPNNDRKKVIRSEHYEYIRPTSAGPGLPSKPKDEEGTNSFWPWGLALSVVIFGIILGIWTYASRGENVKKCICDVTPETIKKDFAQQAKDLTYITKHILDTRRKSVVDSVVLLHLNSGYNTTLCLANQLAKLFAYKRKGECEITTIEPKDVNIDDDYGNILEKYKKGPIATIVQNVNDIEPDKAQIFHTMCDDIAEMKEPSLYLFTLPVAAKDLTNSPHHVARNILTTVWKDLPNNVLDPLVSRILGHVITINEEKQLPCDH